MKKDAKETAALVLALGKPKGETASKSEDSDADEGLEAAAGEFRSALESGDDKALASALQSFVELCAD